MIDNSEIGKSLREIIERVEDIKFVPGHNDKIISKFSGTTISVTEISTGCKTLINIVLNPEKPVSILECGDNVLKEIFSLESGTLYADESRVFYDATFGDKHFLCCSINDNEEVIGFAGIERWYESCN